MWNVLFYVKADQPRREYNYCVSQLLLPLFDIRRRLGGLAGDTIVQCSRRQAIYEVIEESLGEGLNWVPSGQWYFEGTRRFRLGDFNRLEELSGEPDLEVDDMGSAGAVADFVEAALWPTVGDRKACLVIWGHGAGPWTGLKGTGPMKAATRDPRPPDGVFHPLSDLSRGIRKGLKGAGSTRLEILAFDSCLMGCIEAAYEFHDLADHMVASEDLTPFIQWDHREWLLRLAARPDKDARELAIDMLEAYRASRGAGTVAAALRLGQPVADLAAMIRDFAAASANFDDATWTQIAAARAAIEPFGYYNSEFDIMSIDIIRFFDDVALGCSDRKVSARALRISSHCFNQVVMRAQAASDRRLRFGSNGLSLFFPPTRTEWKRLSLGSRYLPGGKETCRFANETKWFDFLDRYWTKTKNG